ncbi:MAG: hypothetical protein R3E95_00040 [Thiolinea sp.]
MNPHHLRALLLLTFLSASALTQAQSQQSPSYYIGLLKKDTNFQTVYANPLRELTDFITNSSVYERMMSSPDFIKVQDIARRLWDNQTGAKRKVRYSRKFGKLLY